MFLNGLSPLLKTEIKLSSDQHTPQWSGSINYRGSRYRQYTGVVVLRFTVDTDHEPAVFVPQEEEVVFLGLDTPKVVLDTVILKLDKPDPAGFGHVPYVD